MDTITITITTKGIHGATEEEQHTRQQFECVAKIGIAPPHGRYTDSVDQITDYRPIKKDIRNIIENGHFQYIETLAETIAYNILETESVHTAKVTIRKLDIWGQPAVTITRSR